MRKYLEENNGTPSSIRLISFGVFVIFAIFSIVIMFILIYETVKCNAIDWTGMTMFVGGLSGTLLSVLFPKMMQKKYESTKNDKNEETIS